MRLFQTSRRFNVEIQPQLVLLQKTLLNIEGMGRELDPNLDLWKTAKPFLEKWMWRRVGPQGLIEQVKKESLQWTNVLPALPRLLHQQLSREDYSAEILHSLQLLNRQQSRRNVLTAVMTVIFGIILILLLFILSV
jgi:ubiquinone biosynthesis protein